ncbi:MAG: YggS family pyridoxal phosphate-dependent enzyme [Actinomycetota bacterium]|nr:YggS family pyridoxal phosphate-dependent enzyme [Actinomycetota bacterium]
MTSRAGLEERLAAIRARIESAADRAGRDPAEVRLVAVAKGVPAERVEQARGAGIEDFGENYVKELAAKAGRVTGATWHFVGVLQSHTAHRVADLADVVHTLAPGRGPERLSRRAEQGGTPIPSLVQVDFTGSRAGVQPDDLPAFLEELRSLAGLEVRGLMTLPPLSDHPEDSRPHFRRLREMRDQQRERFEGLRELSMGMSADYEVAVEEGATMVRIGTALFGERATVSRAQREQREAPGEDGARPEGGPAGAPQ